MQLTFELLFTRHELTHLDDHVYGIMVCYELVRYLTKNYLFEFGDEPTYMPSPISLTSSLDVDLKRFSNILLNWMSGEYRTTINYIGNGSFMLNGYYDTVIIDNHNVMKSYQENSCLAITGFYSSDNAAKTTIHQRIVSCINHQRHNCENNSFYNDTVFIFGRLVECQYPDITATLFNSDYYFTQSEILDEMLNYYNAVVADIVSWVYRYGRVQRLKKLEVSYNGISLHQ